MLLRLMAVAIALLMSGCTSMWVRDWPSNRVPAEAMTPLRADLRGTFESLPGSSIEQVELQVLDDNIAAWVARWQLFAQARQRIDTSYFILSQDVFGMAFLGHLVEKAKAGVHVRILLDAQGLRMSNSSRDVDCLPVVAQQQNISLKIYRPMPRRVIQGLLTFNPVVVAASSHNKIIVVDGAAGLIGGRNIEAKYFADPPEIPKAFHDVDVSMESQSVAAALTEGFAMLFQSEQAAPLHGTDDEDVAQRCLRELHAAYEVMDDWLRAQAKPPQQTQEGAQLVDGWNAEVERFPDLQGALNRPVDPPLQGEIRVFHSLPRVGATDDPITRSLFPLLKSSARDVYLENPYIVLTEEAVSVLEQTGGGGIPMTIVTNGPLSTDNALAWEFFEERWPELVARVPRLRIFVEGTHQNVHSKFAVFDGQVVLVGSYNLDPISMAVNGEIALAVWSRPFAERLMQRPRQWFAQGPPKLYEYQIERDAHGQVVRDDSGKPLVQFGPRHHSNAEDWSPVGWFWRAVRRSARFATIPPIF